MIEGGMEGARGAYMMSVWEIVNSLLSLRPSSQRTRGRWDKSALQAVEFGLILPQVSPFVAVKT